MMMPEKDTIFCIECKCSIEYCLCSCPYCGEQKNTCYCCIDDSKDDVKVLSTKYYSKLNSKKSPFNTIHDDWWRLEKWQIGRKHFP